MRSRGTVSALALGTQKVPNLPGVVTVARGRAVSQPGQNPYRVAYTRHIYVHSCVSWRGVRPSENNKHSINNSYCGEDVFGSLF